MTPTARTLKWLRDDGWTAAVVEHWNHHAKIRQDLFGFADIIAFRGATVMLVQCTSDANRAAHREKLLANEIAQKWRSHFAIALVTWGKHGERGKRKTWKPNVEWL